MSTEDRRTIAPDLILDTGLTWERYKLPIVATMALLVFSFLGWGLYQSHEARVAVAASGAFDSAKTDVDYQRIIDTYPGSDAAANASLLLGRLKYDAKDFAGAAKIWKDFADKFPRHPLVPEALTGQASALEAQGKLDDARALYQRISTSYPTSYAAPLARLDEATLLLSQRKSDEAKHVYEDVIAASPQSLSARIAERGLNVINMLPAVGAQAAPHSTAEPQSVTPTANSNPTDAAAASLSTPPPAALPSATPAAAGSPDSSQSSSATVTPTAGQSESAAPAPTAAASPTP